MGFGMKFAAWIITIIFMFSVVVGSHVFQEENHDYDRLESSMYLSCSRSGWVLGIAWIVWACVHGHGGNRNHFLRRIFGPSLIMSRQSSCKAPNNAEKFLSTCLIPPFLRLCKRRFIPARIPGTG
jgi:hypothetical protein